MLFEVFAPEGEEVWDPDTGETLGTVEDVKAKAEVTEVKERLAVARLQNTQETPFGAVNIGEMQENLQRMFGQMFGEDVQVRGFGATQGDDPDLESMLGGPLQDLSKVQVGDAVREIQAPLEPHEVQHLNTLSRLPVTFGLIGGLRGRLSRGRRLPARLRLPAERRAGDAAPEVLAKRRPRARARGAWRGVASALEHVPARRVHPPRAEHALALLPWLVRRAGVRAGPLSRALPDERARRRHRLPLLRRLRRPAVGASGAIFGLLGGVLGYSLRRGTFSWQNPLIRQLLILTALNLYIGFSVPNISNTAHIGGLLGGLAFGWLVAPTVYSEKKARAAPQPHRARHGDPDLCWPSGSSFSRETGSSALGGLTASECDIERAGYDGCTGSRPPPRANRAVALVNPAAVMTSVATNSMPADLSVSSAWASGSRWAAPM